MFVAYMLIAFGACFVFGFIALTLIGSVMYLARSAAQMLWPAHETVAAQVAGHES